MPPPPQPDPDDDLSPEEFQDHLEALVQAARSSDVTVQGSYQVDDPTRERRWDVEIIPLAP